MSNVSPGDLVRSPVRSPVRSETAAPWMRAVTFGWPPKELSPNSRAHWQRKAQVIKAYRKACWAMACQAGLHLEKVPFEGRIWLHLEFYPPTKHRRDDDNLIAMFKAGRDGLADAMGIDDSRFRTSFDLKSQVGGMVKVRMRAMPVKAPSPDSGL